jgi:hypothetical protein
MRRSPDDALAAHGRSSVLPPEGHAAMAPRAVPMPGVEGAAPLSDATVQPWAAVTANVGAFLGWHQTWQREGRPRAGLLALDRGHHPRRAMTYAHMAQAVSRLERAGFPLSHTFHQLPRWRAPPRRERLGDLRQNGDHAVAWISCLNDPW